MAYFTHYSASDHPNNKHWEQNSWILPNHPLSTADRQKLVGMYYSTWFPFPSQWLDSGGCTWAEPLLGSYSSSDPNVIDTHTTWLTEAGVDFIMIDWSNNCGNADGNRDNNENLWAIEDNTLAFAQRQVGQLHSQGSVHLHSWDKLYLCGV